MLTHSLIKMKRDEGETRQNFYVGPKVIGDFEYQASFCLSKSVSFFYLLNPQFRIVGFPAKGAIR